MTFSRKKVRYPFEKNWLKNVCDTCISRNQGKMFHAVDQYGNVSSSIFIIWDDRSAYYLMGGSRNDHSKPRGGNSLLLWEAIKFSASVTKKFNFEGSMIENVEKFFRGFGGELEIYHHILQARPLIKLYKGLRDMF